MWRSQNFSQRRRHCPWTRLSRKIYSCSVSSYNARIQSFATKHSVPDEGSYPRLYPIRESTNVYLFVYNIHGKLHRTNITLWRFHPQYAPSCRKETCRPLHRNDDTYTEDHIAIFSHVLSFVTHNFCDFSIVSTSTLSASRHRFSLVGWFIF